MQVVRLNRVIAFAATAFISVSLGSSAFAADVIKDRTLRFASSTEPDAPITHGMKKMAQLIEEKSGGKFKVKIFPSAVLGSDTQLISSVQGGTIDLTVTNSGNLVGIRREFGVFDLPFMVHTNQEADAVLDGDFGKQLHQKLEEKGLVGLTYWENGFRNITNNRRSVTTLDVLSGLKLRVIQTPVFVNTFNALGANPVPMAIGELYTSLEQKTVDGQENPVAVILTKKFYEVQKYMTLSRHIYSPQSVVISTKFWDRLNDAEKKIIIQAAKESTPYQRAVSREQDKAGVEQLKKYGVQVSELSPKERQRWQDQLQPVIEKSAEAIGAETIQELRKVLAAVRK